MPFPAEDLTGKKFNRLTVIRRVASTNKNVKWLCQCLCGNQTEVHTGSLKGGYTKSCGCWRRERATTHGLTHTSVYNRWEHMLNRCENPKAKGYANYGGRGIKVTKSWHKFENFLRDMGEPPLPGLCLCRSNLDGNFKPSNCYWGPRNGRRKNQ